MVMTCVGDSVSSEVVASVDIVIVDSPKSAVVPGLVEEGSGDLCIAMVDVSKEVSCVDEML